MAVLKTLHKIFNRGHRVKGSTLMETLIATVLIILIFMIASMILNNLFSNSIKNNTRAIENHLNELQYLQQHQQLQLPYTETYENWDITIDRFKENNVFFVEYEATNSKTNKTITITERDND